MPLMLSRRTTALRIRHEPRLSGYTGWQRDGRRIDLLDSPEVLRPALGARGSHADTALGGIVGRVKSANRSADSGAMPI